ncbi:gas vesicle protein GvpJ [Halorussus halophilus]|uniref:gas vesicle protein GvpJ n=1 Tax=Halorussus halophilus TaxID=2650975 RepID=UPI0013011F29|nr:gas vesicle protein [Halorussus halophilus]
MDETRPTRRQSDLADMLELLLDKGVVINADIAVTVGETELLGVKLRAAVASFETAAKYGMEFPDGTDMERVERAAGVEEIESDRPELDELEIEAAASEGESEENDEEAGHR